MEVEALPKLVELPLGVILRQSEHVRDRDGLARLLTIGTRFKIRIATRIPSWDVFERFSLLFNVGYYRRTLDKEERYLPSGWIITRTHTSGSFERKIDTSRKIIGLGKAPPITCN